MFHQIALTKRMTMTTKEVMPHPNPTATMTTMEVAPILVVPSVPIRTTKRLTTTIVIPAMPMIDRPLLLRPPVSGVNLKFQVIIIFVIYSI